MRAYITVTVSLMTMAISAAATSPMQPLDGQVVRGSAVVIGSLALNETNSWDRVRMQMERDPPLNDSERVLPDLSNAKLIITETLSGELQPGAHPVRPFSLALAMVRWLRGRQQPVIWVLGYRDQGANEEPRLVIRTVCRVAPVSERRYWEHLIAHPLPEPPRSTIEAYLRWREIEHEREQALKMSILTAQ